MSGKRVEYHEGATTDVKNAVAWYQKRSPKAALDFIEELHRAADTIRAVPDSLDTREEQHQTVPALAIPFFHHLLRAGIRNHGLGRSIKDRKLVGGFQKNVWYVIVGQKPAIKTATASDNSQ
jgi:plasmid stabilization system protein ParE